MSLRHWLLKILNFILLTLRFLGRRCDGVPVRQMEEKRDGNGTALGHRGKIRMVPAQRHGEQISLLAVLEGMASGVSQNFARF